MATGITIRIEQEEVNTFLRDMVARLRNPQPAMRAVGLLVRESIRRNFREGGRPVAWPSSERADGDRGQTLRDNDTLYNSFTVRASGGRVEVCTNVVYAAIHHFGGQTRPHVIRAKRGRALFWPGARHPVAAVNHPGSRIPARPFMLVQEEDWADIREVLARYITRGT